jgi:phytoene desaturase
MSQHVIVIGAGMGGLTAALRLRRQGFAVQVLEARAVPGGLAGAFEEDGLTFDAGPYILLDRPGLEWAFRQVGLDFAGQVHLHAIPDVYEVGDPQGVKVRFYADLAETASGLERTWPGSGKRYVAFVDYLTRVFERLRPLETISHPSAWDALRSGLLWHLPFLFRTLQGVLNRTGLPPPVVNALGQWAAWAGLKPEEAPSPLALVSVMIHKLGAAYPVGGVGRIPEVLARACREADVELRYGVKVRRIRCPDGRVAGVETTEGEFFEAGAVVSNAGGVGTYTDLVAMPLERERERLRRLPLQSPGVCAYLAVRGEPRPPYLHFHRHDDGQARVLVTPGVLAPEVGYGGWYPARLIAPLAHATARAGGVEEQRKYLTTVLNEGWWKEYVTEYRVVTTRVPAEWGAQYNLYQDSMNPLMTPKWVRSGRLAHRSPHVRGLYLAGSSTHPGQWVSFCAVSGVLAADRVKEDFQSPGGGMA